MAGEVIAYPADAKQSLSQDPAENVQPEALTEERFNTLLYKHLLVSSSFMRPSQCLDAAVSTLFRLAYLKVAAAELQPFISSPRAVIGLSSSQARGSDYR